MWYGSFTLNNLSHSPDICNLDLPIDGRVFRSLVPILHGFFDHGSSIFYLFHLTFDLRSIRLSLRLINNYKKRGNFI